MSYLGDIAPEDKQAQIDLAWEMHTRGVFSPVKGPSYLCRDMLYRLAGEQNWRCCYCSQPMSTPEEKDKYTRATFEHVIPRSLGGSDDLKNIVVACQRCNSSRGHEDAALWAPKYSRFEGPKR